MKKNKAFTLAETLITLSILGVVAALIIPSIINNWQKRVTITKLQRAYSYIMNNIQETLVVNGCETIGCVLEKHNLYVNTNNLDKSFEQLKIFFPDITKDTQNKCVSSKSPYYDLNHSNANTGNNINVYAGDSYSYKYCLKNNIGLAARPISVPAGNETSITFNCNKHEKNNIYSRCLAFTIFATFIASSNPILYIPSQQKKA